MSEEGKAVTVKQIRSGAGREKSVKATLEALGLGRIGKEQKHRLTSSVCGMLRKVSHLVKVSER